MWIRKGLRTGDYVTPDYHTFSVLDLRISHAHRAQAKVSPVLLILLSVVLPILVITLVSLYPSRSSRGARLRDLNLHLLGLGVSLATATIICTGVKNLTGKPRPDFLARCEPDTDKIAAYAVGGSYGRPVSELWVVVNEEICRRADRRWLNEGFRSFPSGYATIAFAGLWYLTVYLTARFRILHPTNASGGTSGPPTYMPNNDSDESDPLLSHPPSEPPPRPPTFLLILPYVPLGLAIFIAGTRYFDFKNHGVDVLAGAAVGTATASFAFRVYGREVGRAVRT